MVNKQEPFEHDSDDIHLQPLLQELRQQEKHTTLLDDMGIGDDEVVPSWLAELQATYEREEAEPEDIPTERTIPDPDEPIIDFETLVLGEEVEFEGHSSLLEPDANTEFFSPLPPEEMDSVGAQQLQQEEMGATAQELEAEALAENGRYDDAIAAYDQLLQTFPWLPNVAQWRQARQQLCERIINSHFHHIRLAYQAEHWDDVLNRLDEVETLYPTFYDDHHVESQKLARRIAGLRQKVATAMNPPITNSSDDLPLYLSNGLSTNPLTQQAVSTQPPPPTSQTHQELVGFLYRLLQGFVEAQQLGTILFAPVQFELEGVAQPLTPDLAFLPRGEKRPFLIIEVSQPETLIHDRLEKFRLYEQAGVEEYWLIDSRPFQQQIDVYTRNADGCYAPAPPDEHGIFHSKAMTGFWFNAIWLWNNNSLPPVHAILSQLLADAPNLPPQQRELYRQLTQFFS